MKKEIIISTPDVIGGSPRLKGRRLDVKHVIWGITEYADNDIKLYKEDFEVTTNEIRHAIMYCKDEICELQNVFQSCNGCSKKFKKDIENWNENIESNGNVREIETKDEKITKLDDNTFFLGTTDEYKDQFEGDDIWRIAKTLFNKYRRFLNLPKSYEQIINEIDDIECNQDEI